MAGSAYDFVITGRDQSAPAWESLARNAREAEGLLQKLADPVQELQSVASRAEDIFKGFIGFEAISRFVEFHKSVQDSVGAIKAQADAVGYSTDALQAYQAAFRSANVGVEAGQAVLGNFNLALGRALQGDQAVTEAFQQLGVKVLDASGRLRDNNAVLTEASRALLAVDDAATRATLAKTLFGKSGQLLTPVLRETARGLDDLQAAARDAGQIVSQQTIETFDRLKNKSEETGIAIRNFYAELAAPVQLAGMDAIARGLTNITQNIAKARTDWTTLIGLMTNPFGTVAGLAATTPEKKLQDDIEAKRRDVASLQADLTAKRGTLIERFAQSRLDAAQAELSKLEQMQGRLEAATGRNVGLVDSPPDLAARGGDRFAPPRTTGGEKRDRIGEELRQVQANADAAREAYDRLRAAAATAVSTEDLQRQVELQKRIADELARIGKYSADDPRVPQIRAAVVEHERYETALKQLEAALKAADQAEKSFGDGTAELARRQKELNEALGTGRLSQDAYAAATRAAAQAQEEQAAKAGQYKDGLAGLSAGMEFARLQQERQNSAFNQGVRLYSDARSAFSGFFTEMNQGLRQGADVWTTFGNAGLNALNRISDKLMQMAAENLFDAAFGGKGGGGGLFSGLGGWLGGLFGGGGGAAGVGSTIPDFVAAGGFAFADGGRPPVGVPSIVGEEGPEWFVPDQPGTVYPNGTMPPGMGGGASIVINQTVMVGSIVSQAQHERDLARVREEAMAGAKSGLLEDIRSGGAARRIVHS